jgi:hypothetical protein
LRAIQTNRVTTADFAFSSADTKFGCFDRSLFERSLPPRAVSISLFGSCAKRYTLSPHGGGDALYIRGGGLPDPRGQRPAAQWSMMGAKVECYAQGRLRYLLGGRWIANFTFSRDWAKIANCLTQCLGASLRPSYSAGHAHRPSRHVVKGQGHRNAGVVAHQGDYVGDTDMTDCLDRAGR